MSSIVGVLKGGWFPENWTPVLGIGLGVVVTGFLGDTVAGFLSGFVPAEWMNPASELLVGFLLFIIGGYLGGDMSMWLRLFSVGAFAIGIADAITILLGLGAAPAAALRAAPPGALTVVPNAATRKTAVSTQRYAVTNSGKPAGRYSLT
ncbi:unnamed protein product [marine sediment metagenome]|uniref:Uncharacterized protein n=1 Tax=marine sediment metagenome TaxID=412755 RepID=X1LWI3_9ZZZZ